MFEAQPVRAATLEGLGLDVSNEYKEAGCTFAVSAFYLNFALLVDGIMFVLRIIRGCLFRAQGVTWRIHKAQRSLADGEDKNIQ